MKNTCRWLIALLALHVMSFTAQAEDLPASVKSALRIVSEGGVTDPATRLRQQTLTGDYYGALESLATLRVGTGEPHMLTQYELYLKARLAGGTFEDALHAAFTETFTPLDNHAAYEASDYTTYDIALGGRLLRETLSQAGDMDAGAAVRLLRDYTDHQVASAVLPATTKPMRADLERRYDVTEDALVPTPDGATLSAVVVRDRQARGPQPTAMIFTIYTRPARNLREAVHAATHGYAGVLADARGKRLSRDTIRPYVTESGDVNAVIDWVAHQPWADGRVAMYGGSYNGFAQWASLKAPHPALKTIVPYVAAIPGMGLPMENNIFLNANYGWAFYVTGNRTLDNDTYFDRARWGALNENWYKSGRPYREIDAVDGQPNPWLQRWLDHPAYDAYWQAMVPYGEEFAAIDIPVLTITGYYDDGQGSALHYLAEHERHHEKPEHYLVIGPYDHFGAQQTGADVLRGYTLDPHARINTPELTFDWIDHILKGAPKPAILKDHINYQLMGDDTWRHAASLKALDGTTERFYLSTTPSGMWHSLTRKQETTEASLGQTIDLADRETSYNDYYPWPIVREALVLDNGHAYISAPLEEEMIFAGRFSGRLDIRINKRDVDVGITLYELLPDGRAFHLSYYMGRASFARDMTRRQLLTPGSVESVPFSRSRMVARKLSKGSRIVAVVNVNKNAFAEVNHGTGKPVAEESVADAGEPLTTEWLNTSYIDLPLRPYRSE